MKAEPRPRSNDGIWVLLCAGAIAALGCGGKAEGGSDGTDDDGSNSPAATPSASASGAKSDAGAPSTPWQGTPLGPCVLGEEQGKATECRYYAEGRCYAKKLDACACICPRDKETTCSSSFDVPTRVLCY